MLSIAKHNWWEKQRGLFYLHYFKKKKRKKEEERKKKGRKTKQNKTRADKDVEELEPISTVACKMLQSWAVPPNIKYSCHVIHHFYL